MTFSEYPDIFRHDILTFWVNSAQSIAASGVALEASATDWAESVAEKADALTQEFVKRLGE